FSSGKSKLDQRFLDANSALGLQIEIVNASTGREIEAAFASLVGVRADTLFIAPDGLFGSRRVQLATLAARHAIPTACSVREQVEAGGLMSYGTDLVGMFHQTGVVRDSLLVHSLSPQLSKEGAIPRDAEGGNFPWRAATKLRLVVQRRLSTSTRRG